MLSKTWTLAKSSWSVIKLDRELLVLPILNAVSSLVFFGFIWVLANSAGVDFTNQNSDGSGPAILLAVLAVFGLSIINVYFQGALVCGAHQRFTGGDPTISSALKGAASKLHRLIPWAILTATVGIILRAFQNREGMMGRIVASLLDTAWKVLTFLVVPAVMFEDLGPIEGVKRSSSLFKKTWGENLTASVGFGLLGLIAAIPAIALIAVGVSNGFWLLIVLGVLLIVALVVVLTALTAVFQTALYLYAVNGEAPKGFEIAEITTSFGHKGNPTIIR